MVKASTIVRIIALGILLMAPFFGYAEEDTDSASQMIRVHRFPGGTCYEQRKIFEPDMVTYITTFPEHLQVENIEKCVTVLKKKKWQPTQLEPTTTFNTLREARTQNMVCTHWGTINTVKFYQVRFSNYSLTKKSDELVECVSLAAASEDLAVTRLQGAKSHPVRERFEVHK